MPRPAHRRTQASRLESDGGGGGGGEEGWRISTCDASADLRVSVPPTNKQIGYLSRWAERDGSYRQFTQKRKKQKKKKRSAPIEIPRRSTDRRDAWTKGRLQLLPVTPALEGQSGSATSRRKDDTGWLLPAGWLAGWSGDSDLGDGGLGHH